MKSHVLLYLNCCQASQEVEYLSRLRVCFHWRVSLSSNCGIALSSDPAQSNIPYGCLCIGQCFSLNLDGHFAEHGDRGDSSSYCTLSRDNENTLSCESGRHFTYLKGYPAAWPSRLTWNYELPLTVQIHAWGGVWFLEAWQWRREYLLPILFRTVSQQDWFKQKKFLKWLFGSEPGVNRHYLR